MIRGPDTLDTPIQGERWQRRIQVGLNTLAEDEETWVPAVRRLVAQGGGLTCDATGLRVGFRGNATVLLAKHREVVARVATRDANRALVDPWERKAGQSAPGLAATWTLIGADPGPVIAAGDGVSALSTPWPGHGYRRSLLSRGVKHDVVISEARWARPEYRWRLTPGPGVSLTEEPNGDLCLRYAGVAFADVRRPCAHDADGEPVALAVRVEGLDVVAVLGLTGRETWPITIDPTSTISGTANVQDSTIFSGSPTFNFGSSIGAGDGGVTFDETARRTLLRFASASIPAGTITASRYYAYKAAAWTTAGNYDFRWYPIASAVGDWIEGTGTGTAAQTGSCSWNSRQHSSLAWTAAGVLVGTDTGALDHTATVAQAGAGYKLIGNPSAALVTTWRTTTYGVLVFVNAPPGIAVTSSTECGANTPYLEVDYTVGSRRRKLFSVRR